MKTYFLTIFLFSITGLQSLFAQSLSTGIHLEAFAGKYQFQDNKMTFLQITVKDGGLVLKQLWDNQEIPFKQTGTLTFYNDERSFPLAFSKNSQDAIVKVLAFNRDIWNKVPDNYAPELQKIIQLNANQLKACEGKYQLKEGDGDADDFLQIKVLDGHLLLTQLWNQQNVDLWAVSPLEFFNEKQTFPIRFVSGTNGTIDQLIANNKDIWVRVK
jgi:hypothetical protein